jgi:hypothetical protein
VRNAWQWLGGVALPLLASISVPFKTLASGIGYPEFSFALTESMAFDGQELAVGKYTAILVPEAELAELLILEGGIQDIYSSGIIDIYTARRAAIASSEIHCERSTTGEFNEQFISDFKKVDGFGVATFMFSERSDSGNILVFCILPVTFE